MFLFSFTFLTHSTETWKTIKGFFGFHAYDSIQETEHPIQPNAELRIHNPYGSITIASGWHKDTIRIRTTKKAAKTADFTTIDYTVENQAHETEEAPKIVNITTTNPNKRNCTIDLELTIPANLTTKIICDKGNIVTTDLQGSLHAHTRQGNITAHKNAGNVVARTEKGDINITQVGGLVQAAAERGNIT
jgi:hypothetical protein